jgi:hypothetical protein
MLPMTGRSEDRVTYPEFYNLPDGDLLSLYRIGASGNGNLVLNRYDVRRGSWETVQENLIDGQGRRSAYWQAAVDEQGTLHLSWVWRESGDVATNHDLCYAKSGDGGRTWQKSNGLPSAIPITIDNAEVAARIPQQHELMNQTSMAADAHGHPLIATYWREEGTDVPQYHVVHHDGSKWRDSNVGRQTVAFRLGGAGTKGVPISRPQIMAGDNQAYLLYRDEGRGSKVSLAICNDLTKGQWRVADLTESSVARWEPSYDIALWQKSRQLHAFVQRVEQRDGEGTLDVPPEMVYVLEWRPVK